jgi:hypothetical protein
VKIEAVRPPARMDHDEKSRLRAAALSVTRLYPGPAGELLKREILTWEELGYRLSCGGPVMRLVEDVEAKEAARVAAAREERAAETAREAFRRPVVSASTPEPSSGRSDALSASDGPTGGKPYGSLAALWAAHRARQWGHTASEVHR